MSDRRPLLLLLIGLTVCLSMWRISLQEPEISTYDIIDDANGTKEPHQLPSNDSMPTDPSFALPVRDVHRLINLTDFDYLINQPHCGDPTAKIAARSPFVLILVHSALGNWEKRNVIRDTWGQSDARARIYFLLGNGNNPTQLRAIRRENELYRDIIQGNFVDAYPNMTYKHVMALKWFTYNCPTARYLVKADDDVFINTPALYDFLNKQRDPNFLFCYKIENSRIKRTYRSKWRISPKEFPGRYYPPYCPGFAIVYSADAVHKLYKEAQRTKYFWVDDVHVTGTLAQQANLTITRMGRFFIDKELRDNIFNGYPNLGNRTLLFSEANLEEYDIRRFWSLLTERWTMRKLR